MLVAAGTGCSVGISARQAAYPGPEDACSHVETRGCFDVFVSRGEGVPLRFLFLLSDQAGPSWQRALCVAAVLCDAFPSSATWHASYMRQGCVAAGRLTDRCEIQN